MSMQLLGLMQDIDRRRFVVIDTAPTDHTLLLMDATGAYYCEIVRQMTQGSTSRTAMPSSPC